MRSAIRRPKIIRKPTKGMKQFLKQNRIVEAIKSIIPDKKQWWNTARETRALWLGRFNTSKYKPHQGAQEKARRVRQMASGFIRP